MALPSLLAKRSPIRLVQEPGAIIKRSSVSRVEAGRYALVGIAFLLGSLAFCLSGCSGGSDSPAGVPPRSSVSAFPVTLSADKRTLQDQTGAPFPIMGRTAWFVLSLPTADFRTFVDDTAARGYNAIELHVVNHDPRGNNPPFAGNGALPFLKRLDGTAWSGALAYPVSINREAPDFTTPNEVYWAFVDEFLAYCESQGILVFFFPAYVGFQGGNQGWLAEMVANGPAKMQAYGAWIAMRYKGQKNLVWMMGGDMGTPPNTFSAAQTKVERALLTGLNSVAGQQSIFFSAEWSSESIATDQASFGASMSLNGAYSFDGDVSTQGTRAYSHRPVSPAFLLEEPYDEEGPDGNNANPNATQPVRRYQWWGWLSTTGGYISGNGYVWPFNPGWQAHLNTQGAQDMARLNAFMQSIAWYKLAPAGALIVAGGANIRTSRYVAAAATSDGSLVVIYVPPDHVGAITVDITSMSGATRARWFNPVTGAYTVIGTFPNTVPQAFAPPGDNGSGFTDWVLLLEAP